ARRVRKTGRLLAYTHIRHLNPFPANLGDILRSYERVIVPEMNLGQLALLLRASYLVDIRSYSRVRGLPISLSELARDLETEIDQLEGTDSSPPSISCVRSLITQGPVKRCPRMAARDRVIAVLPEYPCPCSRLTARTSPVI